MKTSVVFIALMVTAVLPVYGNYSGSFNSDAKLVKSISVIEEKKLSFGKIRLGSKSITSSLSLVLNPYTDKYDVNNINIEEGSYATASIKISGEENALVYVSVRGETLENDLKSSIKTKYLLNNNGKISLDEEGNQTIKVGGEVLIGNNQDVGHYKGFYTIKVSY